MKLGVNVDHIATLRNARGEGNPNLVDAVKVVMKNDISAITMHLREDRRHIKDNDLIEVKNIGAPINLEMAATVEIQKIALEIVPKSVCIVPERRMEVTTEGGLDVEYKKDYLKEFIKPIKEKGILVSLFIDPDIKQIEASAYIGADYIELHTGSFSRAFKIGDYKQEFENLKNGAKHAQSLGLKVNAGHGLNYENVYLMKEIADLKELNIGHSIISRAVYVGLNNAVEEMIKLIK